VPETHGLEALVLTNDLHGHRDGDLRSRASVLDEHGHDNFG
jgi:hypothetical protein